MSQSRHIVRRSTIELKMLRRMDHETVQARIAALFREHLAPLIGEVLDREAAHCGDLRIEQLELDLGRISLRYLDEEFIGRVVETFEAELKRVLPDKKAIVSESYWKGEKSASAEGKAGSDFDLLACYLDTGALPWWADSRNKHALAEALKRLSEAQPEDLSTFLQKTAGHPARLRRLVLSVEDHLLLRLLRKALPQKAKAAVLLLPGLRERLKMIPGLVLEHAQLRQALWQAVFLLEIQPKANDLAEMAGAMLTAVALVGRKSARELAQACLQNSSGHLAILAPEAREVLKDFAAKTAIPTPKALKNSLVLAEALQRLETILTEPGMSLQRLESLAPVLRDLFHHLDPTASGTQRLRELLQTLSKFISPFLAPRESVDNGPAPAIAMPVANGEISSQLEGGEAGEGGKALVDVNLLAEILDGFAVSGDNVGYDSVLMGSLRQDVQRALLKVQALLRELLKDIRIEKMSEVSEVSAENMSASDRLAALLQSLFPDDSAGRELDSDASLSISKLPENELLHLPREAANRVLKAVFEWQGVLIRQNAQAPMSPIPLLLKIALENLAETEHKIARFTDKPHIVVKLLQNQHLPASEKWTQVKSLLEDWIALESADGAGMPIVAVKKLFSLLDEVIEETGPDGNVIGKNALESVRGFGEMLETEVKSSIAETVKLPRNQIKSMLELSEEEGKVLPESSLEMIAGKGKSRQTESGKIYAHAAMSFLAVSKHVSAPTTALRDAVMALCRFLTKIEDGKSGIQMEKKRGMQAAKIQKRPPFARGSKAGLSFDPYANTWFSWQVGEAGKLWKAVDSALPETAKKRFSQLENSWKEQAKYSFAADLLQHEKEWQKQLEEWAGQLVLADSRIPTNDGHPEEIHQSAEDEKKAKIEAESTPDFTLSNDAILPDSQIHYHDNIEVKEEIHLIKEIVDSIANALALKPAIKREEMRNASYEKLKASDQLVAQKLAQKGKKYPKKSLKTNGESKLSKSVSPELVLAQINALRERLSELAPESVATKLPSGSLHEETDSQDRHNSQSEAGSTQQSLARQALREIESLLRTVLPGDLRKHLLALRGALIGDKKSDPKTMSLKALDDIRGGLDHLRDVLNRRFTEDTVPTSNFSDSDALYVGNAGLVLLWPFMGRFFEKLGLMTDRQFISLAARQKAVLLLQHITTGETQFAEYQLPLSKLLCGHPLHHPLPLELELDEALAEECNALLEVVPAHNPKMKNLTAEGFRAAWLQREGVLKTRDENFVLHIEGKPYDILLEHLPWSTSMLKMQWMEGILLVEW